MDDGRERVAELFRLQAGWCRALGSPLYAGLLAAAADDVRAGGPCWRVVAAHADDPPGSALALRLMGAVHRLVLGGDAPALARFYPSARGTEPAEGAWPAFGDTVAGAEPRLTELVRQPVQTNEVGRCAALVGGFLHVAQTTHRPLRLLEIGASGGLNLRWDHYRYEAASGAWGDPHAPVRFDPSYFEVAPPLDAAAEVVERAGCDVEPIDPTTPEGARTLEAYVWADQRERFERLRAALAVARHVPVPVERASAADWLAARLARPARDTATIVFQSIVMQYLTESEQNRLRDVLADAGRRATASAPLAWLRMEPGAEQADVSLRRWPDGGEERLAAVGFHGRPVRWLA